MIFWSFFLPFTALIFVLLFNYFEQIFGDQKKAFLIYESIPKKDIKREIKNTCMNLLVFGICGLFLGFSIQAGWTNVYFKPLSMLTEIGYGFLTFLIALLIHDFYFYLTHRILHLPFLFKKIHFWHHQSTAVNAWSSFSFHPIEGLFQIGIVLVVAFVLPINGIVLALFAAFLLFMSVYGHCGYELRPNKLKAFNIFNTSFHHAQHHEYVRYNFGIYTTFWDQLFKSNHPDYSQKFEALTKQINLKKNTKDSNRAE